MARSTCIKCGGTRFELAVVAPGGSRYKYSFIQCATCGGVVGVGDYLDVVDTLKGTLNTLKAHVDKKFRDLESLIRRLDRQR